jgi:hypothetical protein
LKQGRDACPVGRVPAGEIEGAVVDQLRRLLATLEFIVRTHRAAQEQDAAVSEAEAREALTSLDPLWDEVFPAEQARIVQLLAERVEVQEAGLSITLRTEGLASLVQEFRGGQPGGERRAAEPSGGTRLEPPATAKQAA